MKQQPTSSPDIGILIVAHGERGGNFDNARLLQLADEVRERLDGVEVEAGVLRGTPSIADGWSRLTANDRFIYPFFMSDGFFCNKILPKKVSEAIAHSDHEWTMLPPFGVSPLLPDGITRGLSKELSARDLMGKRPPLVIAAHGASVDKQSSTRAGELAIALEKTGLFETISCAFLDEAPHLRDVVGDLAPNTIVLPHFNGLGSHSVDDMAKLSKLAPDTCHFVTPVGGQGWVSDVMASDIQSALTWTYRAVAAQ